MMDNDIKNGVIKPLKSQVFFPNEVEKAFRFVASGQHTGKVLVKIRENENSLESCPLEVKPRVYFDPDKSIVLLGGLGGIGLELIEWLAARGCRKLLISSSRGVSNNHQRIKLR